MNSVNNYIETIRQTITNQIEANSISAQTVGNAFTDLATLLGQSTYTFALALGGDISTGADVTNHIIVRQTGILTKAWINAKVAPTGADIIIDIKVNGNSIWNNVNANKLRLPANTIISSISNFSNTAVSEGDILSIDVNQIGSSTPGSSITVQLIIK